MSAMSTMRLALLGAATASLLAAPAFAQSEADDIAADLEAAMTTGELAPAAETDQPEDEGEFVAREAADGDSVIADDATAIAMVNDYLNGLDTLRARFVQIGPDGSIAQGSLYIDRPGRARFEYDPPHPSIIVADGSTVAHEDRELETIDRVPLRSTPLHLVLMNDVDVSEDAEIVAVDRRPGELLITARDPEGEVEGELTLAFTLPALELREWMVLDGLGQQTIISLNEVVRGEELDRDLFELRDDRRPRRRGN